MCGIFGISIDKKSDYKREFLNGTIRRLALLSESRGKESAGFALYHDSVIHLLKAPVPASVLIREPEFKNIAEKFSAPSHLHANTIIGHARLVTNGNQLEDCNNQPVLKDETVAVHNGIIANVDEIWNRHPECNREFEIDTEVFLALLNSHLSLGHSIKYGVQSALHEIEGTISVALLPCNKNTLLLYTNNGSLYILTNNKDLIIFASEKYILQKLAVEYSLQKTIGDFTITQIDSRYIAVLDLSSFELKLDLVTGENPEKYGDGFDKVKKTIIEHKISINHKEKIRPALVEMSSISSFKGAVKEKTLLENNYAEVGNLKRCSKCLLPETFPFIHYDNNGVCNYCLNYKPFGERKPAESLEALAEQYKNSDKSPDCIIPYSGGRDSTYVLHYAKTKLGLNPIAFTYDWGMVTDLARRNIARVCGKLGVENIIVSADIGFKRNNIRKNISSWLKDPQLGMIPLFMAGDKYFFYYCNQIKKQTGIRLNIWGINRLENTDFKTGFAGIRPKYDKKRIYSLGIGSQVKLLSFVGGNYLKNPGYINSSLVDTFGSYFVRYLYPKKDYYHLYDYIPWDEKVIENTILSEYNWEKAVDTESTWRIGDGTAGFYNYIYYTVAGFSENDTFRSNQIREGLISREEALRKVEEENIPRYETIKWYLEIIGLDFENTIKIINKIPKLYRKQ